MRTSASIDAASVKLSGRRVTWFSADVERSALLR